MVLREEKKKKELTNDSNKKFSSLIWIVYDPRQTNCILTNLDRSLVLQNEVDMPT